jgi:hypothetical protein
MIREEQDRESHRHHPSRKQGEGLDMFFRATLIAAAIATAAIGFSITGPLGPAVLHSGVRRLRTVPTTGPCTMRETDRNM